MCVCVCVCVQKKRRGLIRNLCIKYSVGGWHKSYHFVESEVKIINGFDTPKLFFPVKEKSQYEDF